MKALKEALKQQATEIRSLTKEIKESQKAGEYAGILQFKRSKLQVSTRLSHIAYSLNRGRAYEQIELKTRKEKVLTDLQWTKIKQIQSEHEVVRIDPQGSEIAV
jgi:hypothetical protein